MEFQYTLGATPLDPDEAAGLLPLHITTQADLNAWEQANIVLGDRWAARQKKRDLLDEGFVRDLHRQMFDKTWQWAGTFRQTCGLSGRIRQPLQPGTEVRSVRNTIETGTF